MLHIFLRAVRPVQTADQSHGARVDWDGILRFLKYLVLVAGLVVTLVIVGRSFPTETGPECLPNCVMADFRGRDLSRSSLRGGNLAGADLSNADLSEAHLGCARLMSAYLDGVNLSKSNLKAAILDKANLSRAIL